MIVYVSFSDSYAPDATAAQTYVNLLGSYTHNTEMNGLRLSIYTPAEIGVVCGANALACYGGDQMFVSGTQVVGAPPIEQVLAHEYGHHIASHRLNPPWPARDWGPKHWANRMRKMIQTNLGWADIGWNIVDPYFDPEPGELQLINLDVTQPWRHATMRSCAGPRAASPASTGLFRGR